MTIQIPRIEIVDSTTALVHRWGRLGSTILRGGDRLVIGAENENSFLLLVPRGRGRPMLGRRIGGQLMAEPGGFPASTRRWRVHGAVVAVERDLERSVLDSGSWFLCSRIEGEGGQATIERFRSEFIGGWRTASEVDALTLRAALAPEGVGLNVACAVASSPEQARRLLDFTLVGTIRIGLCDEKSLPFGSVIPGPWPAERPWPMPVATAVLAEAAGVQLALFGDSPMMYAC